MNWLLALFSCRHPKLTRPMTLNRQTSVCCLSCGARLAYDFTAMKLGSELKPTERPRGWRTELAGARR